jgi:hypothetical protein
MSAVSPVGTIAYIIDEEALLVRVNNGWQYIAVSCTVLFFCPFIWSMKSALKSSKRGTRIDYWWESQRERDH